MTQDDAFLQDIIENPDDDTPRLVYSDYLEEQGQPERADLIRVQCQLALLAKGDPRRQDLEGRERGLLSAHEEWTLPARELGLEGWTFRRGFIEAAVLRPEVLLHQAKSLFQQLPIREVRLATWPEVMPDQVMRVVADLPQLARLHTLDLTETGLGPSPLGLLAASEYVSGLRALRLAGNRIGTAGVRVLATSGRLTGLTELDLEDAHLDNDEELPAAIEALVTAPWLLSRLVSLDLGSNDLDDQCVGLLARSPYTARLKVLRLGLNPVTAVGVRVLVESPNLLGLQELDLNCFHLRLDRAVMRALVERFGDNYRRGSLPLSWQRIVSGSLAREETRME